MVSSHYLQTVYHRAFIFHMLIGLGKDMTPIDFGITMSKGNVTRVTFLKRNVNMVFAH